MLRAAAPGQTGESLGRDFGVALLHATRIPMSAPATISLAQDLRQPSPSDFADPLRRACSYGGSGFVKGIKSVYSCLHELGDAADVV